MLQMIAAGLLGFAAAHTMMPWVIRFAREYQLLDQPDGDRRLHTVAVPRLGGVAIFMGAVIAAGIALVWYTLSTDVPLSPMFPGVVAGCAIVFLTGVVDDVRGLSPRFKLLAQATAATVIMAYGFRIDTITLGGGHSVSLGVISIPLTLLWIVGVTNAFNLIDGVDGLAGTFALIGLTGCIATDLILHDSSVLVITFALLGTTFAFLRFNRSPARIFLGDSGSMMLGFFLSVRTVTAATTDAGMTYALLPIVLLAYPLCDATVSILRRWIRGHPFSRADGRHIHHQILALGLSPARTVQVLALFFLGVAGMGLGIVFAPPRVTLVLGLAAAVALFASFAYAARWLRYHEFLEVGSSVRSVLRHARSHVRHKVVATDVASRVLDATTVEELGALLASSANDIGMLDISIDAGIQNSLRPSTRQISPPSERPFRIEVPILWEEAGHTREVTLRLWCERPSHERWAGAERIAARLAPALEQWFQAHPRALAVPDVKRAIAISGGFSPLA